MTLLSTLRRVGNGFYEHAFPIYWPFYRAYKKYADHAERALLKRVLFPGAIVADVGANIGVYTEFLSRCVGPNGLVHAFEPASKNFKRLVAATEEVLNVRAVPAAVGQNIGTAELYISSQLNVDHRAYRVADDSRQCVKIDMVTLDDYFQRGERVDLIKMDIQGYELHALRGAQRVINDNLQVKLVFEFWPFGLQQAGEDWRELLHFLESQGMTVRKIVDQRLERLDRNEVKEAADWYINLFAERAA